MSKYLALSSSIPDFFAFLKRLPFFLISLFKFLFIHGRLCLEFDNFDGILTAKIPSMYSIRCSTTMSAVDFERRLKGGRGVGDGVVGVFTVLY